MINLEAVKQWAKAHNFSDEHIAYTEKLAVKILAQNCKMNDEEKLMFMAVYDGIKERTNSPFNGSLHQIIDLAKAKKPIIAGEVYKDAIDEICAEMLKSMYKPVMKGYKAYVREHVAELE